MDVERITFPKVLRRDLIPQFFNTDEKIMASEKIDGAQVTFFLDEEGVLHIWSKNLEIYRGWLNKRFKPCWDYLHDNIDKIKPGHFYYADTVSELRTASLKYDRLPNGFLVLFAIYHPSEGFLSDDEVASEALNIGIESTPIYTSDWNKEVALLFDDNIQDYIHSKESILGGAIEGIVFRISKPMIFSNITFPASYIKIVTPEFKEVNKQIFKKNNTNADKFKALCDSYKSEARISKAVNRLKDEDNYKGTMSDLEFLIPMIESDIFDEEEDIIKDKIYKIYVKDFKRNVLKSVPLMYKEMLKNKEDD